MSTKHTPGPWTAPSSGIYAANGALVAECGNRAVVASIRKSGRTDDDITSNASLIAAAPDLLAALERLLPILDNDGPLPRVYADVGERARAAIAKATGNE